MKMLSVLQRMVENEGRTAIRAIEWFLWRRDEQEKAKSTAASNGGTSSMKLTLNPHPLISQTPKGAPPKFFSLA